ncbi:ABC transporter substrate-binding protein [Verticiella sediminum]|uniref:ABC transporter substrate-binding protein n=1 Tax=Verticiella sediminum TaxID=1247510 RepID=A0A556AB28_9BURK|nr:ABC transporter substrate-binding protein [Verticiella sediminum]TSH90096.1 ABC transporter substrate-binding protein [Verticiella sediminum]
MKRRQFLGTAAAAVGAGLLPGIASVQAAGRGRLTYLTPFTLSLAFAPVLYAQASGRYKDLGLDFSVEVGRGAAQAIQLVAARQVQVGRTGGANYLVSRARPDSNVITIGTVCQISPFVLISDEKKPIAKVEEMEGKIIGMASFGGSMEATLNLMLARAGIDPKSVRRERVADGPASFAMIQAGRLHAFFGNTSTVSRLHAQGLPMSVMNIDDGVPGQVYVAGEKDIEDNREDYVAFMRGTYQAVQALAGMDDKELVEAIKQIGDEFDVPGIDKLDIALDDLLGNRKLWLAHGAENALRNDPEQWTEGARLLQEAGTMEQTDKALYTNAIWEAAVA